jgi:hypothetical protein
MTCPWTDRHRPGEIRLKRQPDPLQAVPGAEFFRWLAGKRGQANSGAPSLTDSNWPTGFRSDFHDRLLRHGKRRNSVRSVGVAQPSSFATGVRSWRNRRLRPKTAFSRFPPIHKTDLECRQRVDLTGSPSRGRMIASRLSAESSPHSSNRLSSACGGPAVDHETQVNAKCER